MKRNFNRLTSPDFLAPRVATPRVAAPRVAAPVATVVLAATAIIPMAGCRSGGMNLFARKGPSAEALAGTGPTTTYPVPPSASATPTAIASTAGGTAPTPAKGPGSPFGGPPAVNYAAAAANGFPTGGVAAASATASIRPPGAPAGSAGSPGNGGPLGIDTGVRTASTATTPNFKMPAGGSTPSYSTPPATPPASATAAITPPSGYGLSTAAKSFPTGTAGPMADLKPSAAPKPSGGFTLPNDLPGLTSAPKPAGPPTGPSGFAVPDMPAAAPPATPASAASATTAALPTGADANIAPVGYTPGSIRAVSGGYPGSPAAKPRSTGSFYR